MAILIELWILLSVACVAAGWILSAFHELNTFGYAIFLVLAGLGFAVWWRRRSGSTGRKWNRRGCARRWRRRFSRLLPRVYVVGAVLAILGGALYSPNNFDALSYRVPRVLHWWAASSWHWIQTPNERMNFSGTGFEWLMMPLFTFTHTDRLFFLINVAAYLLMPGLIFGVFAGLGMPRRTAWYWMWLLPMAPCYLMQAASIGNDFFAVTYLLAAIWFGLRAARNERVSDLWMAILSGALLTGVKGSNLPLALAVGWAIWPALKLIRLRPFSGLAVLLLALLVSYVPTAWFNQFYTGHWTGDPHNALNYEVRQPLAGIVGNSVQLTVQSLEPPCFPWADQAEVWVWQHFPDALRSFLERGFPHFDLGFRELPQEEWSGLGLGVTFIAMLYLFGVMTASRSRPPTAWPPAAKRGLTVGVLAWLSLLLYMTKLGSEQTGRLLASYYPLLLLPILVQPSQERWGRPRWRHVLAACAGATAMVALVLSPARPLWPSHWVLSRLSNKPSGSSILTRAQLTYEVYRNRNDVFAELRAHIPQSVPTIGVIETLSDIETSLWRPFGHRTVVDLLDVECHHPPGLEWVVVKNAAVTNQFQTIEQWTSCAGAVLVSSNMIISTVHGGPEQWSLLRFPAAEGEGRSAASPTKTGIEQKQTKQTKWERIRQNGSELDDLSSFPSFASVRHLPSHSLGEDEEILANRGRANIGFYKILQRKNKAIK